MTGPLIVLVVLIVVALAVGVVMLLRRQAQARRQPPAGAYQPQDPFSSADTDAVRGDPRQLVPGSIVDIKGASYAVRGSLHMQEGSWTWSEHLLETTDGRRTWLSVESDPDLELTLYDDVPGASVPPEQIVEFEGQTYRLEESGSASYTGQGTTGLNPSGRVNYRDYKGPGNTVLSLEEFGDGKWWVSRGETLERHEVQIYPAAGGGM